MTSTIEAVRTALAWRLPVTDEDFDALYPRPVRELSAMHWTPVEVALRVAALLCPEPGLRVLDVGSGAGKMCCIGALATRCAWHGVERDPQLAETARRTAKCLLVDDRATFHVGDMAHVDWMTFDGLYFFNPFERVLFGKEPIPPKLRWNLFGNEVARAEELLASLPSGTRVVTYHGFGGVMPATYQLSRMERIGTDQLALWIQRPSP